MHTSQCFGGLEPAATQAYLLYARILVFSGNLIRTCNHSSVSAICTHLSVLGDYNLQPLKRICYMHASWCFQGIRLEPATTQASLLYAHISVFWGIEPATTQAYLLYARILVFSGNLIRTCSHSSVSAICTHLSVLGD